MSIRVTLLMFVFPLWYSATVHVATRLDPVIEHLCKWLCISSLKLTLVTVDAFFLEKKWCSVFKCCLQIFT